MFINFIIIANLSYDFVCGWTFAKSEEYYSIINFTLEIKITSIYQHENSSNIKIFWWE